MGGVLCVCMTTLITNDILIKNKKKMICPKSNSYKFL